MLCRDRCSLSAQARGVSSLLPHSVILRHNAHIVVISDCERQLNADVVEDLLRLCRCAYRHSAPYHTHTNGLTENANRTLTNLPGLYVAADHKNWDAVLQFVMYAYNTATHDVAGYSPFFLLGACILRTFLNTILLFVPQPDPSVTQTVCLAEEPRRLAHQRTISIQARTKNHYYSRHIAVMYDPGDCVWLWTPLRQQDFYQKFLFSVT